MKRKSSVGDVNIFFINLMSSFHLRLVTSIFQDFQLMLWFFRGIFFFIIIYDEVTMSFKHCCGCLCLCTRNVHQSTDSSILKNARAKSAICPRGGRVLRTTFKCMKCITFRWFVFLYIPPPFFFKIFINKCWWYSLNNFQIIYCYYLATIESIIYLWFGTNTIITYQGDQ